MFKLRATDSIYEKTLWIDPSVEPTIPRGSNNPMVMDYCNNYKNHITVFTSEDMHMGGKNPEYKSYRQEWEEFLNSKGIPFKVEEKFNNSNGMQCLATRINIDKKYIEIVVDMD